MTRAATQALRAAGLWLAVLIAAGAPISPSRGQAVPERDAIITQLSHFDTAPELDVTALRQRVLDKSRSRARDEPEPSKRPPIVPEILGLPTVNLDIHFDIDTPVVRPGSYQTLGRLADALVNASLLPYNFLIVGHGASNGRREANVMLSQRRADAIRDVLVNTFKISSKRIQTLGVGEEQFIDQAHPAARTNEQIQIVTIAKQTEQGEAPTQQAATPPPSAAKTRAKKR